MKRMIRNIKEGFVYYDTAMSIRLAQYTESYVYRRVMHVFSRLGDGHVYIISGILIMIFDGYSATVIIPAGLIAFGLEVSGQMFIKHLTRRPRPFERHESIHLSVTPPDKYSFPSGHTAAAFCFALLIASLYPHIAPLLYIFASLVAISRVANGVHYPSDVVAGVVLGLLSAKTGLALTV